MASATAASRRFVGTAQKTEEEEEEEKTHSKPKHNPLPPPQIQDVIRTVEWDLRTYEYKLLGSPVA